MSQSGKIKQSILKNARDHIFVNISDKNEQCTHPAIIDFKEEYDLENWGGYRYWMAITPYTYGNNAEENPCVCVSQDGLIWNSPEKIANPLDTAKGGWIDGFHSDPELIYNPECNELWMYYRFLTHHTYTMKLIRITDMHSVSNPEIIMKIPYKKEEEIKSMAIWRQSATEWHMWCGKGPRWSSRQLIPCSTVYLSSLDGKNWSQPQLCLNDQGLDPFMALGYSHWHIAAKPNYSESKIDFLCFCDCMEYEGTSILYAECPMNSLKRISCSLCQPVLLPSQRGWDNGTLYRCSFVREGKKFRIWYSACSKRKLWQRVLRPLFILKKIIPQVYKLHGSWYIGYTEGELFS